MKKRLLALVLTLVMVCSMAACGGTGASGISSKEGVYKVEDIEQRFGAGEDDLDNISGFPRTIEGVKLAVTIREEGANKVKMSVRAVPGQDASALCAKFGGGGHKGAAGASMNMTMDEAVEAVIAQLPII